MTSPIAHSRNGHSSTDKVSKAAANTQLKTGHSGLEILFILRYLHPFHLNVHVVTL